MDINELLKKYKSRLTLEAIIKSVLLGVTIGFGANLLYALFDWIFGWKAFYIGIAIWAGVAIVATLLLYRFKFRPTDKQVAQRLDALGLLERVITMNELKNDNSYLARRQRQDALAAVNGVSAQMLKIAISVSLIVAVSVAAVLSAGASVAAMTVKKSGKQLLEEAFNSDLNATCTILYECDDPMTGRIEGDTVQIVDKGKDGTEVTAIAEDGYIFVGWSDGLTEQTRYEVNVVEDMEIFAMFLEAEESEESGEGEGEGEGEGDGAGEEGQDGQSGDPQEGEGEGEGDGDGAPGGPQEGEGSDSRGESGDGAGEGASGGRNEPKNQIIDGETYYGDEYENAVSDAADDINNSDYTGDMADLINDYFNGLGGD